MSEAEKNSVEQSQQTAPGQSSSPQQNPSLLQVKTEWMPLIKQGMIVGAATGTASAAANAVVSAAMHPLVQAALST